MAIYSAVVVAQAVALANDIFQLTAPSNSRVRIREIRLGQYTDFGDAAAEILSVQVISGYTATGSSGVSNPTPQNIHRWTRAPSAGSVVQVYDTGIASSGTAHVHIADAWNIQAGWWYYPPEEEMIIMEAGDVLVVRMSVPADSITMNATLVFEEIGVPAG